MQLEDYFEFQRFDDIDSIRIKGTRVGIEHVIESYLAGESPARIYYNFQHVLSLEQIYATITYYLRNKADIDAYLEQGRVHAEKLYQEYLKQEPPEVVKRLRNLAAERDKARVAST